MKIEQAYSLDAKVSVDAELAYDYYWAGIIKNKQNLECPANIRLIIVQLQSPVPI